MNNNSNLIKAIIGVMHDVKNIEKNMTVGDGQYSYKGVSDKDVKHQVGEAMAKHGLAIVCTDIDQKMSVDRWTDQYGKPKQSIFTEVKTTYLLMHESGESMTLQGYGHGIDSQDKSAGKATTYALKNALLYTFLVPTGSIEDTDVTHSDKIETPPTPTSAAPAKPELPWLNEDSPKWADMLKAIELRTLTSIDQITSHYRINKASKDKINSLLKR